ncbi:MAG: transglutaminaseTgpA domain-containing protein [Ktedonobacteraceae bacterium]
MQDATVDRLAKIISENRPDGGSGKGRHLPEASTIFARLRLAEGWFSFFLLALVVYSGIWSVQVVQWVDHLNLLTPLTALGLLVGMIAAKQPRVPRLLSHLLAVVLGLLLAFWQTSSADYAGHARVLLANMHTWFFLALNGGSSNDNSIFLFFILALGFLLAYTSAWLVYRTRSPWLMLLANAVVLLINLSIVDAGYVVFLVVFLVAALLLLLRFNLYQASIRWRRQGLRCSDDLGWEFMQAGALISLGILVFSWVLPWGYMNLQASQIWTANNNPWVQAQNIWNRLLPVSGGNNPQNHGNFTNSLTLGGNPNLTDTPVFQVKTTDGSQYLISLTYDQYDGGRNWYNSLQVENSNKAGAITYDGSRDLRAVNQTITVINAPGEQDAYLFGASQIASSDQAVQLVSGKFDEQVVSWLRENGRLSAGDVYTVTSYVSNADVQTLETVPMPAASPTISPNSDASVPPTYYQPNVVATYTKLPANLDKRIGALARQITANAPTMYEKVVALESYLRAHYTYNLSITSPPPGVEATSWFLFQQRSGFCNYFATAMTLMARELGIPARVAAGYTGGKFDPKTDLWDIHGVDAHAWTQVYFAGYGWINFEPSASFTTFARPLVSSTTDPSGNVTPVGSVTSGRTTERNRLTDLNGGSSGGSGDTGSGATQIRMDVGIVLLVLAVFILGGLLYFSLWWRRLFQGLSLPSQIYGRVSVMASWAGLSNRRSQTPHEYMQTLAMVVPGEAATFERLGDIYARERWADPQSFDHPSRSGEVGEVPSLWKSLQPFLTRYVLRHPHFLKTLPNQFRNVTRRVFTKRTRRSASLVVVEDHLEHLPTLPS